MDQPDLSADEAPSETFTYTFTGEQRTLILAILSYCGMQGVYKTQEVNEVAKSLVILMDKEGWDAAQAKHAEAENASRIILPH